MSVNLAKHHFTVSEYERMGESGVFAPGARLELIEGEIIEMSPIGSYHAACVQLISDSIADALRPRFLVRTQHPIVLDDFSEPQPDIAVVTFRRDYYRGQHPRPQDILLVVEVADTSIEKDRQVKNRLYARAGIPEFLLVNLPDEQVEYFSQPELGVYRNTQVRKRGDRFESSIVAGLSLDVETILG